MRKRPSFKVLRNSGCKSYSFDKLCKIDLEEHHRALCDAKAAAHLLNPVNQKREAVLPAVLEDAA